MSRQQLLTWRWWWWQVVATKRINFFDQLRVRTEPFTDDLPVSCALYNPECLTIITAAGRNIKARSQV